MNETNILQLQAAIDGIIPPIKRRGREHEDEPDYQITAMAAIDGIIHLAKQRG